jgi:hypothetical protein
MYLGKDGEPFDSLASFPNRYANSRISFDVVPKKCARPRPANMTRKVATMRSPDGITWRETAPTPLPSLTIAKLPPLPSPSHGYSIG